MPILEHTDPYSEIAILNPQDFELRGSDLVVPLHFRPDAAFIVRVILENETTFEREAVIERAGFKEVCEGVYPLHRFAGVFSDLRFTFDALRSTLIQIPHRRGTRNVYLRNPSYTVVDEQGLLHPRV